MLVIRKSQMEVFETIAARRFEEGLLDHFRAFFPQHAAVLGEAQLQRVLRYGLQRAESRGLGTERGIYLYIALMFMLGSRFDEDPQLPWAAREVKEEKPASPKPPVPAEAGMAAKFLKHLQLSPFAVFLSYLLQIHLHKHEHVYLSNSC